VNWGGGVRLPVPVLYDSQRREKEMQAVLASWLPCGLRWLSGYPRLLKVYALLPHRTRPLTVMGADGRSRVILERVW
jgi:hypothetical protein